MHAPRNSIADSSARNILRLSLDLNGVFGRSFRRENINAQVARPNSDLCEVALLGEKFGNVVLELVPRHIIYIRQL